MTYSLKTRFHDAEHPLYDILMDIYIINFTCVYSYSASLFPYSGISDRSLKLSLAIQYSTMAIRRMRAPMLLTYVTLLSLSETRNIPRIIYKVFFCRWVILLNVS